MLPGRIIAYSVTVNWCYSETLPQNFKYSKPFSPPLNVIFIEIRIQSTYTISVIVEEDFFLSWR